MSDATQPPPEVPPGVLARPPGQLHDYPVKVRWEVTRRHPYYLTHWEEALRYRRGGVDGQSPEGQLDYRAVLTLGAIGVGGEPEPPGKDFDELLGGDPDPAFLTGSVQPMTFRALVSLLIRGLPPAERGVVGTLLMAVDDPDFPVPLDEEGLRHRQGLALLSLGQLISPAIDSYPDIPLFYVHLGASQRSITRDVEDQARRWKARRDLGSSKVHKGNLEDYLGVWDLREGWVGGGYDRSRELTFAEVGRRLEIESTSTVANRYRSAFEMITGHPFTPELWWDVFGPLKLSEVLGGPAAGRPGPTRRHHRSPARRPVPESVVSPSTARAHDVGIVEGGSSVGDELAWVDLLIDIRELIGQELTDEQVAQELELPNPALVTYFRERSGEFDSI